MKRLNSILPAIFFSVTLFSQPVTYPKNYFGSPMLIPLKLAGNFGELRPNHFHAGIDITTAGREGLPVVAAAEGYVTRIKIGPYGYGQALYITHPNGYVTVYGHLSAYNKTISAYIEKEQYARESWEIEIFPRPGELLVKKGETVAFSGNTGSSGGPHLHFEIRDAAAEEAINPQLFGLPVPDSVAPVIQTLVIFPMDEFTTINGVSKPKFIPVKKSGKKYVPVNTADSITIKGYVKFAIEAHDFENMRHGKNGVYNIELWKDKKQVYGHRLNHIGFDESRYINCFIDYKENELHKKFYQCSYKATNNLLDVYYETDSTGNSFTFLKDSSHTMKYLVRDVAGNTAECVFRIKSKSGYVVQLAETQSKNRHTCLQPHTLEIKDVCSFVMPERTLYQNDNISITNIAGKTDMPVIKVGSPLTPIQKPCTLSIAVPLLPDSLKTKAFLVSFNKNGGKSYIAGTFADGKITGTVKEFGTYSIGTDTKAPEIKPANFDLKGKVQTDFSNLKYIGFTVTDNFCGLGSYKLHIDGKWVLLAYEPKKRMLYYTFDEHVGKGAHELVLTVADKKGNERVYKKSFKR